MSTSLDSVLSTVLHTPSLATRAKILSKNQKSVDAKKKKEKIARKKLRESRHEKQLLLNLDHKKCDFSTADVENKLKKIATKGVVSLFNAVAKKQKSLEALTIDEMESKKSKLNIKKESDNMDAPKLEDKVKSEKSESKSWSVLSDNFGKPNRYQDWDQVSDDDAEIDDM